jgi:hypothetical protein
MKQPATLRHVLRISLFTLVFALPPITLWAGFCWGGWFSSSALMQHLLQCRCPASSEAVRYQPFIVLAPACVDPVRAGVSADKNWLLYVERAGEQRVMLVDLRSLRQYPLPFSNTTNVFFLRHPLFLIGTDQPNTLAPAYSVYSIASGRRTPLPLIDSWRKELTSDVLDRMRSAQFVYMSPNYIVVLADTNIVNGESSFIIQGGSWLSTLRAQIDAAGISYMTDPVFDYPSVSQDAIFTADGRLSATSEGIEQAASGETVTRLPARLIGLDPAWWPDHWVANDEAVAYWRRETTVAGLGMWAPDWLVVPQPVLLLPATPDYRAPAP